MRFGIFIYPGVEPIDLATFGVLSMARRIAPEIEICTIAPEAGPIELANGHRIRTDFSEIRVVTEGGEWGPGSATAEGNLNGGGPVLKVRTTTGDISFLRASR